MTMAAARSISPAGAFPIPSPIAVLDDDPTGTQEVVDTPVVLDWSRSVLNRLPNRPFHVVTNTRAHSAGEAYRITCSVAVAVRETFADAQLVLRGDSTLRAHLREEYEAVRDVAFPRLSPALLLVPALPAAGRVTIDGIHSLEASGRRVPLHETSYAKDGRFSYSSARLLDWAEERSSGLFAAATGTAPGLAEIRSVGGLAVLNALLASAGAAGPSVCAPDAETVDDLSAIATGLRAAQAEGIPVIVRSAPTFAAVLGGTLARELLPVPRASSLLIVCGSYVAQTTKQLERFQDAYPGALVEVNLSALLTDERENELARVVRAARGSLQRLGVASVATPRARSAVADDATKAGLITDGLARVAKLLADDVELTLFKGGITSAAGVRDGLGARLATVEGPVAPGVALWRLETGSRCLVFPGNVGGDDALSALTAEVLG
jgi:uncharacterized protein YgbK (DUF1537 family)